MGGGESSGDDPHSRFLLGNLFDRVYHDEELTGLGQAEGNPALLDLAVLDIVAAQGERVTQDGGRELEAHRVLEGNEVPGRTFVPSMSYG